MRAASAAVDPHSMLSTTMGACVLLAVLMRIACVAGLVQERGRAQHA